MVQNTLKTTFSLPKKANVTFHLFGWEHSLLVFSVNGPLINIISIKLIVGAVVKVTNILFLTIRFDLSKDNLSNWQTNK